LYAIMKNLLGFVEQRKKMEAEAPTVQVGATPTELTATPPPQPPQVFTGRMPFLPPNCMVHDCLFIHIAVGHHIWQLFPYPPPGDAAGSLQQGPKGANETNGENNTKVSQGLTTRNFSV